MSALLKEILDRAAAQQMAKEFKDAWPDFPSSAFVRRCTKDLSELSLSERASQFADAMQASLPGNYPRAVKILTRALGPELRFDGTEGTSALRYMPHGVFISRYGLDFFEESMAAQYELTKRFTAEFSMRAFIQKYPSQTLERLRDWATDDNHHLRRLASEALRPRLPWAARLPEFQRDPRPVFKILEMLKDDPELYVRRSVANNLNDISKDHPELVVKLCAKWLKKKSNNRRWIVSHALRSLVKQGHRGALEVLGVGKEAQIKLSGFRLSQSKLAVGEDLRFGITLKSQATQPQELQVDYVVHYQKANGAVKPKVFKLKRLTLDAKGETQLAGKISFRPMTTRSFYPGQHQLSLLINGKEFLLGAFELVPAS